MTETCARCGAEYGQRDPAVRWLPVEGVWVCADEVACFGRMPAGAPPWIFGTAR